jgi:hypothetical protein
MNVMHRYRPAQMPSHDMTTLKTVWLMLNKYIARPAKKSDKERCKRMGKDSTARGRWSLSMPSEKNARIWTRLCGLYDGWVTFIYRRAHFWSNVAKSAQVRLMTKLRNQRELTQTAYLGGVNGMDGSGSMEGMRMWVPFESARSW